MLAFSFFLVTEMLAAFRELCREGGQESNRRANEQAAMDRTGRLLGVHLRVRGISSVDRRLRTPEEVTELLLQFWEASGLASSTWTEEEAAVLDEIIAEYPEWTVRGVSFPDGLYVHDGVDDGRGMTEQEDLEGHVHIQLTNLIPPTSQLDSSRRAPRLHQVSEDDSPSLAPTNAVEWGPLERGRGSPHPLANG